MQKITPFLWFDSQAEEAAKYYVSIFKNSRIVDVTRSPEAAEAMSGRPAGSAMTVNFELDGVAFTALNGGPMFSFTEAISFQVDCGSQEEVDRLWQKFTDGGEEGQCGWLKDRFGVSWQIVPRVLVELLSDSDADKVNRVTTAMFQMKKLDIPTLQRAAAQ